MMAPIDPVVRLMLLCDRAAPDPDNPRKTNIYGVVSTIAVEAGAAFPVHHPEISVYLLLTEGRGTGQGRIVVVNADTEEPAFSSAAHPITFGPDPLALQGRCFRILDCTFPAPGLYWVEFRFNGKVLARQPLEVKQR